MISHTLDQAIADGVALTHAQRIGLSSRAREFINTHTLIASDIAAFVLAAVAANGLHWLFLGAPAGELLRLWGGERSELRLLLFAGLVSAALIWFWVSGHYTRRRPFWDELAQVLRVLLVLAVLDAALLYLAKLQFSRVWFLGNWLLALLLVPLFRHWLKALLMRLHCWQRPAVVLGASEQARDAALALQSEPALGFDLVAFVQPISESDDNADPLTATIEITGNAYPVLKVRDPVDLLTRCRAQSVVVALDQERLTRSGALIQRLHRHCEDLHIVPPVRGIPMFGATVYHFLRHEVFFLTVRNNLARRDSRLIKRSVDLCASAALLLLLSPLFLLLALLIKSDGGPVLFGHSRIGKDGKPFRCLKFRSMVPNAPAVLQRLLDSDPQARAEWEKDFKLRNDPRITRLGRFLRRSSLDELPQLINVLKGEMSLVGPRPIVEEELERYGDRADFYLESRPGITGLWQISGRNDADYNYRVYLDSWYAKNWSLWYDLVILLKTVGVVWAKQGAY